MKLFAEMKNLGFCFQLEPRTRNEYLMTYSNTYLTRSCSIDFQDQTSGFLLQIFYLIKRDSKQLHHAIFCVCSVTNTSTIHEGTIYKFIL